MTAVCRLCRQVIRASPPILGRSTDPVQLFGDAVARHLLTLHKEEASAAALFGFNVQALEMFRVVSPTNDTKFYEMIALACARLAELLEYWSGRIEQADATNATKVNGTEATQ